MHYMHFEVITHYCVFAKVVIVNICESLVFTSFVIRTTIKTIRDMFR